SARILRFAQNDRFYKSGDYHLVINKIDGVGGVRSAQPVKRTAKTGSAGGPGFARHLDETGAASESAGTAASAGINAVSAVLGAQEAADALSRAAKGKARAEDMLDLLDNLRLELLLGGISRARLLQLARIVSQRRPDIADPRLAAVLDEIDLRAQVELAK